MALRKIFIKTCCNKPGTPVTNITGFCTDNWIWIFCTLAWLVTSSMVSVNTVIRSTSLMSVSSDERAKRSRFSIIAEAFWILVCIFRAHSLWNSGETLSSNKNCADDEQTASGLRISWAMPPAITPKAVNFCDWRNCNSSLRRSAKSRPTTTVPTVLP